MPKIGFIGAGTVGNALAVGLSGRGYPVVSVSSRSLSSAEGLARLIKGCHAFPSNQEAADNADLIFITTPDDSISSVVSRLEWHRDQSVVHCSGADSADILEPARKQGAQVGAFHPLQTFASVEQAAGRLPGVVIAIEAREPLLGTLKEMAAVLGGQPMEIQASDKILYHTAAVMVSNYTVTLVKLAADLWQSFGAPPNLAVNALLPLLRGTISNLEETGIPDCLTGPIARGDIGTVRKHLDALDQRAPGLLATYRELARQTIPIALAKGRIDGQRANELRAVLAG
jgi:predicted short-subunit dehydrogenase-like oxidoreductase (DUF2520 family)